MADLIVRARLKAADDMAVMTAWNTEAFARTKRLKPLAEYLKPPAAKSGAVDGARAVRALFERFKAKQEAGDGAR